MRAFKETAAPTGTQESSGKAEQMDKSEGQPSHQITSILHQRFTPKFYISTLTTMTKAPGHFLEGKKIIVAGGGLAGCAFAVALYKLWDPALQPPEVVIFDRDTRESTFAREGYSLSLNGTDKDGGLVAIQELGMLGEIVDASVHSTDSGRFKMWDSEWRELLSIRPTPYGDLPSASMRIARRDLRRILLENAEKTPATIHWGVSCKAVQQLGDGRTRVTVASAAGDGVIEHECDLLIAADGSHSKVRASLRPDDNLKYAGAVQMGGNGYFPDGLPSPLDENWGLMLSGTGCCCFFSAVDKEHVVWALSIREEEQRQGLSRGLSPEAFAALQKEALEIAKSFGEPFSTIVEATDPSTAFVFPACDKVPFYHDKSLTGVVFIGDSNHAVSPFAGNGANLAMKDGWDLAEKLCQSKGLEQAVVAYDRVSVPRAKSTLKTSHTRIELGHCTGVKYTIFRTGLAAGRFFKSILGE